MAKVKQVFRRKRKALDRLINVQLRDWEERAREYLANEESVAVLPASLEESIKNEADGMNDEEEEKGNNYQNETFALKSPFGIKKYILAIRILFSNCHFVLKGGFTGRLTSLINGSYGCLKLASLGERNFNRDEDVIAYIAETQQKAPRSNANTTWTAGMVTNSISLSSIFWENKKVIE